MHTFDPFNATKAHAINVHFQAFPFHFITVSLRWFIAINELAIALGGHSVPSQSQQM
jgi:hypothetical protein